MGFGFNLFFLPMFLIFLGALGILYLIERKKWILKLMGISIIGVIVFVALIQLIDEYRRPMAMTREAIDGTYVIDTNRYPGKNARWEYEHFRFKITSGDSFILSVKNGYGVDKKYVGHIDAGSFPPHLTISCQQPYFDSSPALYRTRSSFHLVWNSRRYKNMFFWKMQ